jgi:hypothetical protein
MFTFVKTWSHFTWIQIRIDVKKMLDPDPHFIGIVPVILYLRTRPETVTEPFCRLSNNLTPEKKEKLIKSYSFGGAEVEC